MQGPPCIRKRSDPAHIHRRGSAGLAGPSGSVTGAPPAWGRWRRLPAHRERGGLALHAHRRARSRRVRPGRRRRRAGTRGGRAVRRGGLCAGPAVGPGAGAQRVPALRFDAAGGAPGSPSAGRRCRRRVDMVGTVQGAGTHWCFSTTPSCPTRCSSTCPPGWGGPTRSSSSTGVRRRAPPPSPGRASASARGPSGPGGGLRRAGGRRPVAGGPGHRAAGGAEASLSYVSLQILGDSAWFIARLAARGATDSSCAPSPSASGVTTTVCALTSRSSAAGRAARSSRPISGTGTQVHDIRTLQDHVAPRTNSELLCQGAVAGTSRSVYSGLIRVHRGAVRSDAAADQPQPRPRRGCARRLGPQSGHLGERREVLPCLHRRPDRRGPALLHRVARGGARGGGGADRAGLLQRHHRPGARPGRDAAAASGRSTTVSTPPSGRRRVAAGA